MEGLVWLLPAVLAPADWYAVARDDRRTERWAKPAVLLSLLAVVLVLDGDDGAAVRWLLVALVFGLVGDVALLSDSLPRFRVGLLAFLVGHLAYVGCFVSLGLEAAAWSWLGLGVLVTALAATRGVVPATHRLAGSAVSVPVAVYSVVIGAMLVTAWWTAEWLVALGASVFVASDSILSVNRFVRPLPHARLALIVTYQLGQALIVAGVITR